MHKIFAYLTLIATVAGTVGPMVSGFAPKYGLIVGAVGATALAVQRPVTDLTEVWKKALGRK